MAWNLSLLLTSLVAIHVIFLLLTLLVTLHVAFCVLTSLVALHVTLFVALRVAIKISFFT